MMFRYCLWILFRNRMKMLRIFVLWPNALMNFVSFSTDSPTNVLLLLTQKLFQVRYCGVLVEQILLRQMSNKWVFDALLDLADKRGSLFPV